MPENRFRCDRGWDIDLDDGSSNYLIEENLCLNGGIKLREGFFRTVRHNIMINNTLHFHAWYPESGDIAYENILFEGYAPYAMPIKWGERIDRNYFAVPGLKGMEPAEILASASGQDTASVCIDPQFTSSWIPANPQIHGFENFPREFGVRYEPLRKLADAPGPPTLKHHAPKKDAEKTIILSMTVKKYRK